MIEALIDTLTDITLMRLCLTIVVVVVVVVVVVAGFIVWLKISKRVKMFDGDRSLCIYPQTMK